MNGLEKSGEDGLARVAMILTLSPIGVAVGLMIAGSLLGTGAMVEVAAIFGVSATVLIVAGGCSLVIFERVVVRDMRRVTDYLRAARRGEGVRPPLGIGGVLAEILDAAEEVVQSQAQLARTLAHQRSIEQLRESFERAARESLSQQMTISRAVLGLADDFKSQSKAPPDAWVGAVASEVEARVTRLFSEGRVDSGVASNLESVRHVVQDAREETSAIDAQVRALGDEIRASRGFLETLPSLIRTHGAMGDRRPDSLQERLQKLELALTEKLGAIAALGASPSADAFEAQIARPLRDLRAEIDNGFAAVSTRLDRAADHALFRSWDHSAGDQGRKLDRLEAGMVENFSGLQSSLANLPPRLAEIEQTSQRIVATLEDIKQIKSVGPLDLQLLFARLERLFAQIDGVAGQASGSPSVISDIRVALADQAAASATQAMATETLARGVEKALGIVAEGRIPDEVIEAVAASTLGLQKVASELIAIGRASDQQSDAAANLLTELAALRGEMTVLAEDRSGSRALATQLEALESRVADCVKNSSLLLTEIAALPAALADRVRPLAAGSVDSGLSNDPPASASELSAGVESLRQDFGALAGRIEDALTSIGRAASDGEARSGEARAGIGRLLEAVQSIHARFGPIAASRIGGTPGGESLTSLFEDMGGRLDQLAERIEHFIHHAGQLASSRSTPSSAQAFASPYLNGISNQIEEIAGRLDEFGGVFETLTHGQGRFEPIFKQSLAPLQDRVVALAEASELGFSRLAGQFGQLAAAVATAPKTVLSEARNLIVASQIDLSPLQRRIGDLQGDMKDLAASLTQASLDRPSERPTADPFAIEELSRYLRAEMDALHGRLDHFASRIDQIADLLDEAAPPLFGGNERRDGRHAGAGHDLARRIDDLKSTLARTMVPELAPMAQRIETASTTLVESLREWRASTLPRALEAQEGAARSPATEFNALQTIGLEFRQSLTAAVTDIHARFDDLHGRIDGLASAEEAASRQIVAGLSETLAAPVRDFADATLRLTRLANSVDAAISTLRSTFDPSTRGAGEPSDFDEVWAELRTKLDSVLSSVERLAAEADATRQTSTRGAAPPEASSDVALSSRWEQFQATIAETLFTLESRWERSLVEFRESLAAMNQLSTVHVSLPVAEKNGVSHDGVSADRQHSLSAALKTMSEFTDAIEKRFVALETMAEAVKAGSREEVENGGLIAFGEQLSEMRRLTGEFLDISCAISGELEERRDAA
jgi:hypothetical protein